MITLSSDTPAFCSSLPSQCTERERSERSEMCLCYIKIAFAVPLINEIKTKQKARSRMPHIY